MMAEYSDVAKIPMDGDGCNTVSNGNWTQQTTDRRWNIFNVLEDINTKSTTPIDTAPVNLSSSSKKYSMQDSDPFSAILSRTSSQISKSFKVQTASSHYYREILSRSRSADNPEVVSDGKIQYRRASAFCDEEPPSRRILLTKPEKHPKRSNSVNPQSIQDEVAIGSYNDMPKPIYDIEPLVLEKSCLKVQPAQRQYSPRYSASEYGGRDITPILTTMFSESGNSNHNRHTPQAENLANKTSPLPVPAHQGTYSNLPLDFSCSSALDLSSTNSVRKSLTIDLEDYYVEQKPIMIVNPLASKDLYACNRNTVRNLSNSHIGRSSSEVIPSSNLPPVTSSRKSYTARQKTKCLTNPHLEMIGRNNDDANALLAVNNTVKKFPFSDVYTESINCSNMAKSMIGNVLGEHSSNFPVKMPLNSNAVLSIVSKNPWTITNSTPPSTNSTKASADDHGVVTMVNSPPSSSSENTSPNKKFTSLPVSNILHPLRTLQRSRRKYTVPRRFRHDLPSENLDKKIGKRRKGLHKLFSTNKLKNRRRVYKDRSLAKKAESETSLILEMDDSETEMTPMPPIEPDERLFYFRQSLVRQRYLYKPVNKAQGSNVPIFMWNRNRRARPLKKEYELFASSTELGGMEYSANSDVISNYLKLNPRLRIHPSPITKPLKRKGKRKKKRSEIFTTRKCRSSASSQSSRTSLKDLQVTKPNTALMGDSNKLRLGSTDEEMPLVMVAKRETAKQICLEKSSRNIVTENERKNASRRCKVIAASTLSMSKNVAEINVKAASTLVDIRTNKKAKRNEPSTTNLQSTQSVFAAYETSDSICYTRLTTFSSESTASNVGCSIVTTDRIEPSTSSTFDSKPFRTTRTRGGVIPGESIPPTNRTENRRRKTRPTKLSDVKIKFETQTLLEPDITRNRRRKTRPTKLSDVPIKFETLTLLEPDIPICPKKADPGFVSISSPTQSGAQNIQERKVVRLSSRPKKEASERPLRSKKRMKRKIENINVTKIEDINVTKTEDINVTKEDINVTKTEDINVTKTEDINVTKTEDINVTKTEDINVTTTEDINVTKTEDINLTKMEHINLTKMKDNTITNLKDIVVTNMDKRCRSECDTFIMNEITGTNVAVKPDIKRDTLETVTTLNYQKRKRVCIRFVDHQSVTVFTSVSKPSTVSSMPDPFDEMLLSSPKRAPVEATVSMNTEETVSMKTEETVSMDTEETVSMDTEEAVSMNTEETVSMNTEETVSMNTKDEILVVETTVESGNNISPVVSHISIMSDAKDENENDVTPVDNSPTSSECSSPQKPLIIPKESISPLKYFGESEEDYSFDHGADDTMDFLNPVEGSEDTTDEITANNGRPFSLSKLRKKFVSAKKREVFGLRNTTVCDQTPSTSECSSAFESGFGFHPTTECATTPRIRVDEVQARIQRLREKLLFQEGELNSLKK